MYDPNMPLDQAMAQYAPQVMPGTLSPEQQAAQAEQQALVQALRQPQVGMGAPAQAGQVQSAGYVGDGMDTGAIGKGLGKGIGSMFGGGNPAPADLAGTDYI